MKPQTDWSRRTFLRGLGAAIALPSLPSALPLRGLAALGSQEEHPLKSCLHVCSQWHAHARLDPWFRRFLF